MLALTLAWHYQYGGPAFILTEPDHPYARLDLLRRFFAMIVLGATIFSSAESALALKPDARLHGRVAGAAKTHDAAVTVAGHGHADAESTGHRQPHQGEHRHGSMADHCTHAHAVGLAASVRWIARASEHGDAIDAVVAAYTDADPHRALRPPRA
ncbi:MAG: hypothetical protein C0497_15700 [Gemmatimonas sp.]|nr:hypothetical protein [Gemmatimonas sp.]